MSTPFGRSGEVGRSAAQGGLHPQDAIEVASHGIDEVKVSNHSGRQLNSLQDRVMGLCGVRDISQIRPADLLLRNEAGRDGASLGMWAHSLPRQRATTCARVKL